MYKINKKRFWVCEATAAAADSRVCDESHSLLALTRTFPTTPSNSKSSSSDTQPVRYCNWHGIQPVKLCRLCQKSSLKFAYFFFLLYFILFEFLLHLWFKLSALFQVIGKILKEWINKKKKKISFLL